MADPAKAGEGVSEGATAIAPSEKLSLTSIAADLKEGKQESVLAKVARATKAPKNKTVVTAESPKNEKIEEAPAPKAVESKKAEIDYSDPEQYKKWYDELPVAAKTQFATNVYNNLLSQAKKTVGPELYDLAAEVLADPDVRATVQKLKLTNKELRTWLVDTAVSIYEDPRYNTAASIAPAPSAEPPKDPRVDQILARQEAEDRQRAVESYQTRRANELSALINEAPVLRYDPAQPDSASYKRVSEIMDYAEGLETRLGRPVTYKEAYERIQGIYGAEPTLPPSVPHQTSGYEPPRREPPATKAESNRRMKETLEKYGGLTGLARSMGGTR
jgi:hypothetical protein